MQNKVDMLLIEGEIEFVTLLLTLIPAKKEHFSKSYLEKIAREEIDRFAIVKVTKTIPVTISEQTALEFEGASLSIDDWKYILKENKELNK